MATTAIEQQIRSFVEETFFLGRDDALEDSDSFLDHGVIDSTGILELIAFVQERYGIQIEDDEAIPENLDSIDRISAFLRRKLELAETAAIVPESQSL